MTDDKEIQRRLKISQTLKGRIPWNKGLKAWRVTSEETRKKIGLAHKGKIVIVSEKTRKKISQTMKGKRPPNLSLLHVLPRTKEWRRKIGLAHKGLKHTEETKEKIARKQRNPLRPLYRAIRECWKYDEWHKNVFERDDYACRICGRKGEKLHADHIKPFALMIKEKSIKTMVEALNYRELWDINNGRTLCIDCHKKTSTWGFRKLDNDIVHTL